MASDHLPLVAKRVWQTVGVPLSGFVTFLLLWWLATATGAVSARHVPAPSVVLAEVSEDVRTGILFEHLGVTLYSAALALAIGMVLGAAAAGFVALIPGMRRFARPYVSFFNSVPRVALAPIFILFFGIDIASKVAIGVSLVAFITFLSVQAGLLQVDHNQEASLRSMGARKSDLWRYLHGPNAVPYLLASLRTSAALALLGVVAGELILSVRGLGWLLRRRGQGGDVEATFAVLLVLLLVGLLINFIVQRIELKGRRWT